MKVTGKYPDIERVVTGLWSFDRAVGNPYTSELGLPLRSQYELYGPPESGKTTFSLQLAAWANPRDHILMASLEIVDKRYVERILRSAGYEGEAQFVAFEDAKKRKLKHNEILTAAVNRLGTDEKLGALVLDSVAAIVPPLRDDQPIGTGYQTDLARFMADLCLRVESKLMNRETPALFIAANHVGQSLDPAYRGHITKGGKALKFHAVTRIYLYRKEGFPKTSNDKPDKMIKGFLAEGKVEKLRFGGKGRRFRVYMVPGTGVHAGMTALFDCTSHKLATKDKSGYVWIGKKKIGRIGQFVNDAYAGKSEVFEPFIEKLVGFEDPNFGGEEDEDVGSDGGDE